MENTNLHTTHSADEVLPPPVDQNNNVETQTKERPFDAETQTDTNLSYRGSRHSSMIERSSDR